MRHPVAVALQEQDDVSREQPLLGGRGVSAHPLEHHPQRPRALGVVADVLSWSTRQQRPQDADRTGEQLVVDRTLERRDQVTGRGGGVRRVLVHDRVAEALAQEPGLDLPPLRTGQPLHDLDPAPPVHPLRQLPQLPLGVVGLPGQGHRGVERELLVPAEHAQHVQVLRCRRLAEQGHPELHRFTVLPLAHQPGSDVVVDARILDAGQQLVDERQHPPVAEVVVEGVAGGGLAPPAAGAHQQCQHPAQLGLGVGGPGVVTQHAVQRPGGPAHPALVRILVGQALASLGQAGAAGVQVSTDVLVDAGAASHGTIRRSRPSPRRPGSPARSARS